MTIPPEPSPSLLDEERLSSLERDVSAAAAVVDRIEALSGAEGDYDDKVAQIRLSVDMLESDAAR